MCLPQRDYYVVMIWKSTLYSSVMYVCGGALRHSDVKLSSSGARATSDLSEGTTLLLERTIVREHPSVVKYPKHVRDTAAAMLVQDVSRWFMVEGATEEDRSANARMKGSETIKCQLARMYRRGDPSNAIMCVSPIEGDDTVAVYLCGDVVAGDEVKVQESSSLERADHTPESREVWRRWVELQAAERALERWKSVDIPRLVEDVSATVAECTNALESALEKVKCAGPEWLFQICDTYVHPSRLPHPPTINVLHCEHAEEALRAREKLGVRDAQNKLQQALESFKKC
jgi:hypothetical protein